MLAWDGSLIALNLVSRFILMVASPIQLFLDRDISLVLHETAPRP
jgi:hypothetical protein